MRHSESCHTRVSGITILLALASVVGTLSLMICGPKVTFWVVGIPIAAGTVVLILSSIGKSGLRRGIGIK